MFCFGRGVAISNPCLRYTIIRPFNAVGIGEQRAREECDVKSGNVKLAMSHVVPDLVQKVIKGQNPLHILGSGMQRRHYTYAQSTTTAHDQWRRELSDSIPKQYIAKTCRSR